MNPTTTTLRGIFPEPRATSRRNFIKENVKHIREIQQQVQEVNETRNAAAAAKLRRATSQKLLNGTTMSSLRKAALETPPRHSESDQNQNVVEPLERLLERGVQTEKNNDLKELYKNGVIKYPSPHLITSLAKRSGVRRSTEGQGDGANVQVPSNEKITETNGKHDFVKENVLALKRSSNAKDDQKANVTELPTHYQKGTLPKYLQQRKEELIKAVQPECPEGHVLLSDEERKETLKVLRQCYADRIQELNSMPVRNDTLRALKRKMELEEELKKIDEGIKVFQRPKVFVKINA